MGPLKSRKVAILFVLVFQVVLIVLFSIFVNYDASANPQSPSERINGTDFDSQYPMFQDIHVMVLVGFGFLMTFLKKYAFSSLGFTFLIASLVMQWTILCQGFFRLESISDRIPLSLVSIMTADIVAAVILISLGVVLGKISPIQLFFMSVLETVCFTVNEFICSEVLQAVDAGGSVYVHAFGAFFGLAVSFVLARGVSTENEENTLQGSTYQSDISAMIGTLFLWVFWPSFNAGLLSGDEKVRAVINTYLALTSSCLTVFVISVLFNKTGKFEMAHVQNATLAGGVGIGTSVNMMIHPYGALIVGSFAGFLALFGFKFFQGFLAEKMRVHDTCGVNNLHGLPGLAAGLIGALMAALANQDVYGVSLFEVFPAMGPSTNRSPIEQAAYQLLALTVTLFFSILTGLITGGFITKMRPNISPEEYYNDNTWWNVEEPAND